MVEEEEETPKKMTKIKKPTINWSEMNTELLALVFTRIKPIDAMVRTIPFVCKSWKEVLSGPDCWAYIDLEPWCRRVSDVDAVDSAVCKLVRRSGGTLKSLYAFKLSNSGFDYACNSGSLLRELKMPMSVVTDQMLEKQIKSLSMLTVLNISHCLLITSKSIEIIGNQCKSLIEFWRNMPPVDDDAVDESEALAVANTMHGIKHLELAYGRFSNHGLDAILSNCTLHVLDIRGCWNVALVGRIAKKTNLIKEFWAPWANDDMFGDLDVVDGDAEDDEGDSNAEDDEGAVAGSDVSSDAFVYADEYYPDDDIYDDDDDDDDDDEYGDGFD